MLNSAEYEDSHNIGMFYKYLLTEQIPCWAQLSMEKVLKTTKPEIEDSDSKSFLGGNNVQFVT